MNDPPRMTALKAAPGQHRLTKPERLPVPSRRKRKRLIVATTAIAMTATVIAFIVYAIERPAYSARPDPKQPNFNLPTTPGSYIGLYTDGVPDSYAGVTKFTTATGVKPRVVLYYSGWSEPFRTIFAAAAARNGAVPLIQIEPTNIKLSAIASGKYDNYLNSYAKAVRAYGHPVILSFGHEMNGYWYTWSYRQSSPSAFVAAWRHIVTLFRAQGAVNVTWLWTINTIGTQSGVVSPTPWWPGASYVTWVGIDGYYYKHSTAFSSLFGPTIVAVRKLTGDPILIAETAATSAAHQSEKITDLFTGTHIFGLLGFVWFDHNSQGESFLIQSSAAFAAFRKGASIYSGRRP